MTQPDKQHRRIVINIPKHKKNKQLNQLNNATPTDSQPSDLHQQLPKLLQISQQCQSYCKAIQQQQHHEQQQTEYMFTEVQHYLQSAFLSVFEFIQMKKNEIKHSIDAKKSELYKLRNRHYRQLGQKMTQIRKLEQQCDKTVKNHKPQTITIFANKLSNLLSTIEQRSKYHHTTEVQRYIHSLKGFIEQQSSAYKSQNHRSSEMNISFTNQQLFSGQQSEWDLFVTRTKNQQKQLDDKLDNYRVQILS